MAVADRITMTMRELDRFKVIQAVVDQMLKPGFIDAAQFLQLATRKTANPSLRMVKASACEIARAFN
jgi:hypothetical protein